LNNCPFLGQDQDPQTHISFSSEHNYCYRTEKPTAVLPEQQQKYCLTKNYPGCPVYQDISHLTLPVEVGNHAVDQKRPKSKIAMAFSALLMLIAFVVSWFYIFKPMTNRQPVLTTISVNTNAIPSRIVEQEAVIQSTPSPTFQAAVAIHLSPTPTELPTSIPFTAVPLGLGTPSKTTPQLLIHQIVPGDSLALLAKRFGTSVAAIRNVNYFLPVPLWEGVLVIIPINTIDVSDLPAFEPYQVKDRSMTLKDVAFALNTDPKLLNRYNPGDPNAFLFVDSWLMIPRPFPPPTGLPLETPDGKIQNYGG
jgi:hypothetical protein